MEFSEENSYWNRRWMPITLKILKLKFENLFGNYYITPCEFFTPALADGLSLEFKWQQISSGLQNSSQNSGRPQQRCSLDGLCSSFSTPPTLLLNLWESFQVHQLQLVSPSPSCSTYFCSLSKSKYLSLFSFSLIFMLWSARAATSTIR